MAFKVITIVDGETIKVSPNWVLTTDGNKLVGDELKIKGYKVPPVKDYVHPDYAKEKLTKLLINREVVLKNPEVLKNQEGKIACSVFVDNVDVSYYFPEYKQQV